MSRKKTRHLITPVIWKNIVSHFEAILRKLNKTIRHSYLVALTLWIIPGESRATGGDFTT
jgi:hypothetical protein